MSFEGRISLTFKYKIINNFISLTARICLKLQIKCKLSWNNNNGAVRYTGKDFFKDKHAKTGILIPA